MAGVQADPEAPSAAGGLQERRELLEGAPERAARAGGVLQMQRAALGLGQRLAERARRRERSPAPTSPVLAEPGCRTTPRAPIASPTRSEWVSEASDLGADLGVVAGAVEQVDGVDQDGADLARGDRLAEARRSPPRRRRVGRHMRGDWLKIWIARQPSSVPRSTAR